MRFKLFKKLLNSISKRTFILIMSFIILSQLLIFIFYIQYNKEIDNKYYRELLVNQIMVLIQRIENSSDKQHGRIIDNVKIPNTTSSINDYPIWPLYLNNASLWAIYNKIKKQENNIQLSIKLKNGTWLNIKTDVYPWKSKLSTFVLIFEILTSIFIFIFLWLVNQMIIPLQEIKVTANRLGADLNTKPLKPFGPTMVRNTLHAINNMQERIQILLQERMQMIAAISHDLRTPMARLRLRSEFTNDPAKYQKNMEDLDEMEEMINETLSFITDDHQRESKNNIDLTALLISISNDFIDAGYKVNYLGTEDRKLIFGSALALKRAFTNIIDNSIKYAGNAEVNLYQDKNTIKITISDDGPGLTEEQLERVFTAFYRVNKSRSRRTGGTGLGLTIARNIILGHNGTLILESRIPQGLIAIIGVPSAA